MLDVSFAYPEHGWMPITIHDGQQHLVIDASDVSYGALEDLIAGLIRISRGQGDSSVIWCTEPVEYDMKFTIANDLASLSITEWPDGRRPEQGGKRVFHGQYPPAILVKSFCEALRALQGEKRETEFRDAWGTPFPAKGLSQLTESLER